MPDEPDDPTIVTIGDLQLRRLLRHQRAANACTHPRLDLDTEDEVLTCRDCGVQVGAYWALDRVARQLQDARRSVKAEWEQARWERKKHVQTIAARKIEAVWRRKMLPCCPNCGAGILPEDGMGDSSVCRELEMQRRNAGAAGE